MPDQLKSEVVSLPKLVKYGSIQRLLIERYQRPYAWGEEEIETLFQDHFLDIPVRLSEGSQQDVDPFVGSIVLLTKNHATHGACAEVIDGQQRLTTLTLTLAMAYRKLVAEGEKPDDQVKEILFADPSCKIPRLVPKEQDKANYDRAIDISKDDSELAKDLKELAKALKTSDPKELERPSFDVFKVLTGCFQNYLNLAKDKEIGKKQALRALIDSIINHLRIVVVVVDGYSQGMAVFESLNARGQPLTVDQLFKNLLMLTFTKEFEHELIEEKWERGSNSFETCFPKPEHRDKFLLYYHRAFFGHIQKRLLYASFRRIAQATKGQQPNHKFTSLSQMLEHLAENWKFISKYNGPLKSLGGEVFRPALMAVRERFADNESTCEEAIARAAFVFESALVRIQICKTGIGRLDANMATLCEKIRSGELGDTPYALSTGIREFLKGSALAMPDDSIFKAAILSSKYDLKGRREGLIFSRLHQNAEGTSQYWQNETKPTDFSFNWSDQPLGNPSSAIVQARGYTNEEHYHSVVHSLGNVVILPPGAQRAGAFNVNDAVPTSGAKCNEIETAARKRAEKLLSIYKL